MSRWTPEREAALAARLEAATPGPWRHVDDRAGHQVHARGYGIPRATVHSGADAQLIAHAPADLADLLEEVRQLRAQVVDQLADPQWIPTADGGVRALVSIPWAATALVCPSTKGGWNWGATVPGRGFTSRVTTPGDEGREAAKGLVLAWIRKWIARQGGGQ